jgi:hypothetical protein
MLLKIQEKRSPLCRAKERSGGLGKEGTQDSSKHGTRLAISKKEKLLPQTRKGGLQATISFRFLSKTTGIS